jgi:hypothetical protein
MPYNPSSFSDIARRAPQAKTSWVDELAKGFRLAQMPREAKQKAMANELAAQLGKSKVKGAEIDQKEKLRKMALAEQLRVALGGGRQGAQAQNNTGYQQSPQQTQVPYRMDEQQETPMPPLPGIRGGQQSAQQVGYDDDIPAPPGANPNENIPNENTQGQNSLRDSFLKHLNGQNVRTESPAPQEKTPNLPEGTTSYIIEPGMPGGDKLNKLWEDPLMREAIKDAGYNKTSQFRQSPETGQVFETINWPNGKKEIRVHQVGTSISDQQFQKAIGGSRGDTYKEASQNVRSSSQAGANINHVIDLMNNPEFENISGPVNSFFAKYTGSDEQADLLGQMVSSSNEIVLSRARTIPGTFTNADLAFMRQTKGDIHKDFAATFRGKMKALKVANDLVGARNAKVMEHLRAGDPEEVAVAKARKEVPIKPLQDAVERIIKKPDISKDKMLSINLKSKKLKNQDDIYNYWKSLPPNEQKYLESTMLGGR